MTAHPLFDESPGRRDAQSHRGDRLRGSEANTEGGFSAPPGPAHSVAEMVARLRARGQRMQRAHLERMRKREREL
jgi:hypothetical protein